MKVFPIELIEIICNYIPPYVMKSSYKNRVLFPDRQLRPCEIDERLMYLSRNPNAVDFLQAHPEYINWESLSANSSAMEIIEANMDLVNKRTLCANPSAMHLIRKMPEKEWSWRYLARNKNAMDLIEANLEKVNGRDLCLNPSAIHIIEQHPELIHSPSLSQNENAIHLLKPVGQIPYWMSVAANPNGLHLIYCRLGQTGREYLATNPSVLDPEYIPAALANPNIFTNDYCYIALHELKWDSD